MRAMDLPIQRMIFFETSHALRFTSDKTKTKLRMFQQRILAKFIPTLPDDILIKLGYFSDRDLHHFDTLRLIMLDDLIEHCFCGSLFSHGMKLYIR